MSDEENPDDETQEFVISPPGTPKERIIGCAKAIQETLPDLGNAVTVDYADVRSIRGYAENILIQAGKLDDRSRTTHSVG